MPRAITYAVLVSALMLVSMVAYDLHQRDALIAVKKTTKAEENIPAKHKLTPSKPAPQTITVEAHIKGIRTSKGQIIAQLYDDLHAFNNNRYEQAISTINVPAKGFNGILTFDNLSNKQYALVLFHDENDNLRFDQVGSVLEGYAYSNNVGKTSLPNFRQAAFTAGPDKQLIINMIYH